MSKHYFIIIKFTPPNLQNLTFMQLFCNDFQSLHHTFYGNGDL